MGYDVALAERVRDVVKAEPGMTERRMFGGLAFLVHGNLAVSANSRGDLLLRTDPADAEPLLREPHVRRFRMRGRELAGWLNVGVAALRTEEQLSRWVRHGIGYAASLPPK
jgi:TfoX/Sxy family transcriptional regulator of competence genes